MTTINTLRTAAVGNEPLLHAINSTHRMDPKDPDQPLSAVQEYFLCDSARHFTFETFRDPPIIETWRAAAVVLKAYGIVPMSREDREIKFTAAFAQRDAERRAKL